jgi:hypothetical protein
LNFRVRVFLSRSKGGSKGPRESERHRARVWVFALWGVEWTNATGIMLIQHLPLLSSKRIVLASASPRRSELLRGLVCLKLLLFPFSSLFSLASVVVPGYFLALALHFLFLFVLDCWYSVFFRWTLNPKPFLSWK